MTDFWREGFWRTSSSGTLHEVAGHWVRREEWDRSSSGPADFRALFAEKLRQARVHQNSTAAFVNPNAECPACGQSVFFFQNRYGSKVYFDDLGPPWPKHPCTDSLQPALPLQGAVFDLISPNARNEQDVSQISYWLNFADIDLDDQFSQKYGLGRWKPWVIRGRYRGGGNVLLVLESADQSSSKRLFIKRKRIDQCFTVGVNVYQFRNWMACFDPEVMKPVELEFQRISGSSAFIDQLTSVAKKKL